MHRNDREKVGALLSTGARFAVTCHIRPDGDAIGSAVGLCRLLAGRGADVHIVGVDSVPDRYTFLLEGITVEDPASIDPAALDAVVIVDCSTIERAPAFLSSWVGSTRIVSIDHHGDNTGYGDLNLIEPAASSVGEMLYRLAVDQGMTVCRRAAEALWVALVTDTGRFAFSNTTPEAMQAAAGLVACGIDTFELDRNVFHSLSVRELRLQERAIAGLELRCDERVAAVSVSRADMVELGAAPADLQDIVEIPRSLAGVELAAFLYETKDEGVKVSLRSVAPHDVAAFCRERGGGGHARAAGCTCEGSLAEVMPQVLSDIEATFFGCAV